ncbi:LANO_0H22034g1_1 [Lachancea nothofagi CBS 11611]|uniref:LANO_0H22034g1_1 n=1 Tax=Lachancea nothofagi CBS 11611 TaxID=1266666 RepID=A0A1G4KNU7_9SACH|nr:LANO_0H22034g1_1 [Lachancea nothofagi CBS 11611]
MVNNFRFAAYDNIAAQAIEMSPMRTIEDSLKELERYFSSDRDNITDSEHLSQVDDFNSSTQSDFGTSGSDDFGPFSTGSRSSTLASADMSHFALDPSQSSQMSHQHVKIPVHPESRYFVIKSCRSEHIEISNIKNVWSSTELGNRRLSKAFQARSSGAHIFLLFSVNGSGCFCGLAEMTTDLRDTQDDIWMDKRRFKRVFSVRWLITHDIPNNKFRHLRNPLNEMKSVTQSRDTQEIPLPIGRSITMIFEESVKLTQSFSAKTTY